MWSLSSCESRDGGREVKTLQCKPTNNGTLHRGPGRLLWLHLWPAASPQILGSCDSNARTEFGSASELRRFSVHNIKVVCSSISLMCKEGKAAGAVTCSVGPFLLRRVGGREKMPLQNIWFEQEGAVRALLSRHTATHQKTSVRGGQHSSKSGTRKCCTISNT